MTALRIPLKHWSFIDSLSWASYNLRGQFARFICSQNWKPFVATIPQLLQFLSIIRQATTSYINTFPFLKRGIVGLQFMLVSHRRYEIRNLPIK